MILLLALVVSLIIALARGGSLLRLGSLSFHYGWLALLAFGAQTLVIYARLPYAQGILAPRTLLLMVSYGFLFVPVIANRQLPGMPLIGLGLLLNLTVMVANGGFMPVTPEALQRAGLSGLALSEGPGARLYATKDVLLLREETRLWLLSDILVIPPPLGTVFSIGDILLAGGACWFLQKVMVGSPRKERAMAAAGPSSSQPPEVSAR
jgi:hypothetical protein